MNQELYENYVRRIAQTGSMTKAAQEIGISQPALSSGLAAMERHLGFRIFERRQSPLSPTEEGKIYLDFLRRKSAMECDLRSRMEAYRGKRDRRVSVGAPVVYAQLIVADAVSRLLRSRPDYDVSVLTAPLDRLIELTADGELDCFVCTGEVLPEDFAKTELYREQLCLCVPKADPLNNVLAGFPGGVIPVSGLTALRDVPFILLEHGQPIREQTDALFAEEGVALRCSVTVDQVSTAVSLAVLGVGCCFAPREAVSKLPGHEKLAIYRFPEEVVCRRIYAAYHSGFYQPQACRELIACMKETR